MLMLKILIQCINFNLKYLSHINLYFCSASVSIGVCPPGLCRSPVGVAESLDAEGGRLSSGSEDSSSSSPVKIYDISSIINTFY